jgi:hypothetical protein
MKAQNTAEIIQAKSITQWSQKARLELPLLLLACTKAELHIHVRDSKNDIRQFLFCDAIKTKRPALRGRLHCCHLRENTATVCSDVTFQSF